MQELTRIRNERGWSQQKLSDVAKVNKATINQIERGRRSPNVETLEKLATALGVELGDLFPKVQARLPLDAAGQPGTSYEEAAGSTPEERAERAEALANVAESMAAAHRESLGEMSEASAGELFGLYMQASLIHVGLWHLAENEGYAGLTRECRLEAALGEVSRVAEEIEQAMETAEVQEDLPDGVASLTAYQRRRATPARDTAPAGPSRRVRYPGEPSWAEVASDAFRQAADPTEAPIKGA